MNESNTPHLRVLIVDDNALAAAMLSMLMETAGHEAQVAHNGIDALAAVDQSSPHLVLLDIGLPGMNGYEVAAGLRKKEPTKDAIIIAVSGYGQPEDIARSRESGCDGHLVKPIDFDELDLMIRKLIAAKGKIQAD